MHQNQIQNSVLPKVPVATFLNVLTQYGWKEADGVAIATKEYQSAVGIKVAFAYLTIGKDYYRLSGNYQSCGNNILSNRFLLIEKPLTESEIEHLVHDFALEADEVIEGSYAVRLLRASERKPGFVGPVRAAAMM